MQECEETMKEYGKNIKKKKICRNTRRSWRNMWLWNLKERSESSYIPFSLYNKALAIGKSSSSPHISSGTYKNSELHPLYRRWNLEEWSTERGIRQVVIYVALMAGKLQLRTNECLANVNHSPRMIRIYLSF